MRKFVPVWIVVLVVAVSATGVCSAAELFTRDKSNKKRLEPTAETAAVYVFRPAMLGAAIKTWSFYGDELIGVSKGRAYAVAQVPAGKHIFWSKAENTSALELEVEAGKTYYFKQAIKVGINKARVSMVRIDEADAMKFFEKCAYTEPTAAGRARAVEIAANRLERAETKVERQAEKAGKKKKKKEGGS